MDNQDNAPAYFTNNHAQSMLLRDYFAAAAMQGILSGNVEGSHPNVWQLAQDAYKVADAMLKTRGEK